MAKPTERLPLLFLEGRPPQVQGFTSPGMVVIRKRGIDRDPVTYAVILETKLSDAWKQAEDRKAVVHSTRDGCYLQFVSEPGQMLALKSLENISSGIRLQNVTKSGEKGREQTFATVYVPNSKRGHFLQKIKDFGDVSKNTETNNNPKNQSLLVPIADITAAILKDFWTDRTRGIPGDKPDWVEVWISTEDEERIESFRKLLEGLKINEHQDHPLLKFPERSILLIWANGLQLAELIEHSDLIAELRKASEVPTFFLELSDNREQAAWCNNLLLRLVVAPDGKVAVCILDHGINQGHPLLKPLLAMEDLHTIKEEWGTADDDGHGTMMAGLAGYGNLQSALEGRQQISVRHRLESSKILPPPPATNPKHLWGERTAQGISRAEIQAPECQRIICLAIGATDTRAAGHPTSWSAELDALCAGVDGLKRRLIVVSAGNVNGNWLPYPEENLTNEIHDPAQAWNALSVGAFTFKTRITSAGFTDHKPMAPAGGLSPFSTTSNLWEHNLWPIKPEIVLEGGNVAVSPSGQTVDVEDLKLLTTGHRIRSRLFEPFEATSAATAQASWMAASIQDAYPNLWPETVRGLLVHSASWNSTMEKQFRTTAGKTGYQQLLRTCGYGVPNLDKAISCLRNSLTLVAQNEIQPFFMKEGEKSKFPAMKEMHLHNLPWPTDELLALGETKVEMRVTLSYFIEPGPGEVGWSHRYRYASHGLRFELNGPGETESDFVKRINKQALEEDEEKPETEGPSAYWKLGRLRNVGSLHSDIWTGTAADLATSNLIAVRPVIGWWRERTHLGKLEQKTRYSLIVSIETPTTETDIYTPVATKIKIKTPIPVEIPVRIL